MTPEKNYVEEFVGKLKRIGWREREPLGNYGIIVDDVFKKKVMEINTDVFDQYDKEEIFQKVKGLLDSMNEVQILDVLKHGITVFIKKWNAEIPLVIKLVDYENPERNDFFFIREQVFRYGLKTIRPDITLYINGIPVVVVEAKDPMRFGISETYMEALNQLMRYQNENPELFKFVQFGVGLADRNPYMPTFPRDSYETPVFSFWKVGEGKTVKENILHLLEPKTLIEFMRHFIFFTKDSKGRRRKILARYMQFRATIKVMEKIRRYLRGKSNDNKGLVWHWQGSGKTYTMFFIANWFIEEFEVGNPTVFFVIDRTSLEMQLDVVLNNIEYQRKKPKRIERIEELAEVVKNIENEWGLKIVTIQKFSPERLAEIEGTNKKNVLFLIDEAHRSQYGDLAGTRRKLFPKAMFFGFTGTPVLKKERNTFAEFGSDDELYTDVYFIRESQEDGFTLPITYRIIEESSINVNLKEDELKKVIEELEENPKDVESFFSGEEIKDDKIKDKLTHSKIFLESEKRIGDMVAYLKDRIDEDTENFKFKAMIVATNRIACTRYKKRMDKVFGEDFSEVVMTYKQNESEDEVRKFRDKMIKKYGTSDMDRINKIIEEKFRKEENPKVLIVTDKLLTGFDAPILKVMYLDKPLFFHRLLQAIARVNRPYPELDKKYGLIVDSIGLLRHIEKVLGLYEYLADKSGEIREEMFSVLKDATHEIEILDKNVRYVKEKLMKVYGIDIEKLDKNIIENREKIAKMAMSIDKDEKLKKILTLTKESIKIYRSLGSEPKKLAFLNDIKNLSRFYFLFLRMMREDKSIDSSNLIKWIQEKIEIGKIVDRYEVDNIAPGQVKSIPMTVLSMSFYTIVERIKKRPHNPLYAEIYKKVMKLKEEWETRNIGTEEFLKILSEENKILDEIEKSERKNPAKSIIRSIEIYSKIKGIGTIPADKIEKKISEVLDNRRLLDIDKKEIRLIVAKEIIKLGIPRSESRTLEKEITDIIIKDLEDKL